MPQNPFFSSMASQLKNSLSTPILPPLLESRTTGLVIAGAAIVHAGLVTLGLPGWPCPLRYGLGIPCPGCGLGRAIAALLRGNWQTALTLHAFAPLFLLALILIACGVLLPSSQRCWLINRLEVVERRTGITAILLFGFVLYWLARLLILREAFINLIVG